MAYSKKKTFRKRPRTFPKGRKIGKKAVKREIKRTVKRMAEHKTVTYQFTTALSSLQNGAATITNNFVVVNPSNSAQGYTITAGTGDGQMEASKIELTSCHLNMVVTNLFYDVVTNPQPKPLYVRAYLFKSKVQPVTDINVANICGPSPATFFDRGTTTSGFLGTLMDLNYKQNSDDYIPLATKTFKLGPSIPQLGTGAGGPSNQAPQYQYANNDFKYSCMVRWNITKYLPKKQLKDSNGNWYTPRVFLLFQVVNADNSGINLAYLPAQIEGNLIYRYLDM